LGTEFGVLVKAESGKPKADEAIEPGIRNVAWSTEVHVFRGKVEISESEQRAPDEQTDLDAEKLHVPRSPKILATGEAAVFTANEIAPLAAADPFRFVTEAFDGRSRQVLVTEDFEAMPAGASGRFLGDWLTEYASGRHQHIVVVDPSAGAAGDLAAIPPVGKRAMEFANSAKVAKDLHPLLRREVDGQKFPANCKLLLECDIAPQTADIEPSLSVSEDYPLRLAPAIELSREADPEATKVEWQAGQWYRLRVVWDVQDGAPQGATVERLEWRGADGWVRDASVRLPAPQADLDPLAQVRFGFPAPLAGKAGGTYWLDNVRMEVLGAQ
jgi:hypothetical protein